MDFEGAWYDGTWTEAPTWLRRVDAQPGNETTPGASVRALAEHFRSLEALSCGFRDGTTDANAQLEALAKKHTSLKKLWLGLSTLWDASPLRALALSDVRLGSRTAPERGWGAHLAHVPHVWITRMPAAAGDLAQLAACTRMTFRGGTLRKPELAALATLPALRSVELVLEELATGAIESLANAKALSKIAVYGRALSAKEAKALAGVASLRAAHVSVGDPRTSRRWSRCES